MTDFGENKNADIPLFKILFCDEYGENFIFRSRIDFAPKTILFFKRITFLVKLWNGQKIIDNITGATNLFLLSELKVKFKLEFYVHQSFDPLFQLKAGL